MPNLTLSRPEKNKIIQAHFLSHFSWCRLVCAVLDSSISYSDSYSSSGSSRIFHKAGACDENIRDCGRVSSSRPGSLSKTTPALSQSRTRSPVAAHGFFDFLLLTSQICFLRKEPFTKTREILAKKDIIISHKNEMISNDCRIIFKILVSMVVIKI